MQPARMPERFETERLLLRPFRLEDEDDVFAYAREEAWTRYLPLPRPYERQHARTFLATQVGVDRAERPSWAIVLDARVQGGISLRFHLEHDLVELGYSTARAIWGRGIATEAARALIDAAFELHEDLNRMRAMADVRNRASRRVLEKLGFRHEGVLRRNRVVRGEPVDEAWYGLLRPEWRAGRVLER